MSLGEAVFFDSFSRFDLWIVLLCWAPVLRCVAKPSGCRGFIYSNLKIINQYKFNSKFTYYYFSDS